MHGVNVKSNGRELSKEEFRKQVGAELGQDQPGLGSGLKKFGLNISNGGLTTFRMSFWGLQMKSGIFYFASIALLGLN